MRVIELAGPRAGIAVAHAGWLLSKMGADVSRVATADAAPDVLKSGALGPVGLALEVLAEGKSIVHLASPNDHPQTLLAGFDVLLTDDPAGLAHLFRGSPTQLQTTFSQLIIGIVTTFGLDGPYARYPGSGLDAQALSAVAWSLGEPGRAPLALPPGIVEHQAGAMLAAGCLVALTARDDGGQAGTGRVVDIALSDVLASFVAGNCRLYVNHGLQWQRSGRRASGSGGAYPYMILPCKDGAVCICGRTSEEWQRFVDAMGNPEWASQPRYQDLRAMGTQYPDEVDRLLTPWLAQKSKAELEAIALRYNLIVSPIRGFDEVLQTGHFRDRGFFSTALAAGKRVTVPSLPFRAIESRVDGATDVASSLLRGDRGVCPTHDHPASFRDAPQTRPQALPLSGLRVLDFGWVWSAPWVGTMLSELGAEVIKVEHALRPDNMRLAGRVFRDGKKVDGPTKEMSPMFHQINHGKLGITLNAKQPRAVELLLQLTAISDVVIENMSPGSMERSHLGYDALAVVNPKLVMLSMSAAGQFGALSTMRAYAPTMSSFVGMEALVGYPGEEAIGALNFGIGDPNASVHALAALLAALRRVAATGRGCYIDFSQIEALLLTLRPYLIDTQVNERQTPTIGTRHPEIAPHGIYPAVEDDAWLTLVASGAAQWDALKRVAGDGGRWMDDVRFRSNEDRLAHVAELDAAIARWTSTQPRDELVTRLREAGVASSPVLSVQEQWRDAHYAARGIRHEVEIPVYGIEGLYAAPWRFSDFAPQIDRCGPGLGEHNRRVFGGLLGMSDDEIAALQQSGVIA